MKQLRKDYVCPTLSGILRGEAWRQKLDHLCSQPSLPAPRPQVARFPLLSSPIK